MSADQPLTGDELAAMHRVLDEGGWIGPRDVPRLVAEVEQLRAREGVTPPRAYPGNAVEYGGMVHYVDDDHKTHHPDVTCPCSPTPVWTPRP